MSILLSKLLQAPFDEGNDLPGDSSDTNTVVDRGDAVDAPQDTKDSDALSQQAEDDLKELEEEKPRDEKGRFQKKEVPDHVPKARMDEAVGKERAAREAAERRAAELEARVKQEEKSVEVEKMEEQVEALEKQHAKHLLDGEDEKAAAAMKQIRHMERQIARMETEEKTSKATAQAVEQVRMEATIAKLEADYPVFNPESDTFDQDLVDIVLAEQARLIQNGVVPSKALSDAASKIMKKFAPADKEDAKGLSAAKGSDRKQEQVAKNLDTAKRQPASMRDTGKDSDKAGDSKIDVSSLTADEFNALPEATKRRLRGDDM